MHAWAAVINLLAVASLRVSQVERYLNGRNREGVHA